MAWDGHKAGLERGPVKAECQQEVRGPFLSREGRARFIRDFILFDMVLGGRYICLVLQMRNLKLKEAQ